MDNHGSPAELASKPHSPTSPPMPVPLDVHWRVLTESANAAHRRGETAAARAGYEAALAEAERLLDADGSSPATQVLAVIYNVSCHNLAELAAASGRTIEAEDYCRRACDRLLAVAGNPAAPLELRLSCIGNLRPALAELAPRLIERTDGLEAMRAAFRF